MLSKGNRQSGPFADVCFSFGNMLWVVLTGGWRGSPRPAPALTPEFVPLFSDAVVLFPTGQSPVGQLRWSGISKPLALAKELEELSEEQDHELPLMLQPTAAT